MGAELEDLERLKQASFYSHHVDFVAAQLVISLATLRDIAKRRGIAIEGITVEHIIAELKPMDDGIRSTDEGMQRISARKP